MKTRAVYTTSLALVTLFVTLAGCSATDSGDDNVELTEQGLVTNPPVTLARPAAGANNSGSPYSAAQACREYCGATGPCSVRFNYVNTGGVFYNRFLDLLAVKICATGGAPVFGTTVTSACTVATGTGVVPTTEIYGCRCDSPGSGSDVWTGC